MHVFSGMPYLHIFPFKHFSGWLAISTLLKVILLLPLLESLPRIPKTYFISNYSNYPESWYYYYRIKFFMVYIFKMLFSPALLRLILGIAELLPPRSSIFQSGLKNSLLWLCPNFNAYLVQSVFRKKKNRKNEKISDIQQRINKPGLLQNKELQPVLAALQFFCPHTS